MCAFQRGERGLALAEGVPVESPGRPLKGGGGLAHCHSEYSQGREAPSQSAAICAVSATSLEE